MIRLASPGHALFAATFIGLGVLGLIQGDFTPIWAGVPKGVPARESLAYLCACVSLLAGIGLLWQRTAVVASCMLLTSLLLWLLAIRVSRLFLDPPAVVTWWACAETAAMAAGAWVLYAWFASNRRESRFSFVAGDKGLCIARVLYGLALIPFGIAHFTYFKETVVLVPGWLPAPDAWAYFTGAAFIAAGVAILVRVYGRLAATLSAWEMGLLTLLVWVPIVAGEPNAYQWSEFVDSLALTAAAWVVADSYRGVPWLALSTR